MPCRAGTHRQGDAAGPIPRSATDRARLKPVGKGQAELMNTSNPIAPENRRVTIKTILE